MTKQPARLSVMVNPSALHLQDVLIWEDEGDNPPIMRAYVPIGVVLTACSVDCTAAMDYHMELSSGKVRCTLDEHITQRAALVTRLRNEMTSHDFYLDLEGASDRLSRLLQEASTNRMPITLYTPQGAAQAVQSAVDAGRRVIKGKVEVGLQISVTTLSN